jgi:hypothetical protein
MAVITRLRARWYLVIVAVVIAALVAGSTLVGVSSKGIHRKRHTYYVGTAEILVDSNPSTLTNTSASGHGLNGKAALIAQYATDPGVVRSIAHDSRVPLSKLTVQAASSRATKTGASAGSAAKTGKGKLSVLLRATNSTQTINISTQSKKPAQAGRLAHGTVVAVRDAIRRLHNSQPINRVSSAASDGNSTSVTSTTTATTSTTGTTGKKSADTASRNAARAQARAQAQKRAAAQARARAEHNAETSTIVLRQLGAINTSKVVVAPSTSKAVGYGIVVLIVLLVIILVLDNLLGGGSKGRGRRGDRAPTVAATGESADGGVRG